MTRNSPYQTRIRPNGTIVVPLAGTIRWEGGKNTGVWGADHKIVPLIMSDTDGSVRELTSLEKVLFADQIKGVRP